MEYARTHKLVAMLTLAAYRFHISDFIPFRTGLRVAFEHDGINSNQVPYASVAYYYANPAPGMLETDSLLPADAASANAHAFQVQGSVVIESVSSRYFSETASAETHPSLAITEACSFSLAIPQGNAGVVLRRLFDQAKPNQRADVFVNGTLAGTWYSAGGDAASRWREDEFWIPAALTRNHDKLDIRLVVSGPISWNASQYRVFALRDVGAF
jgi:hypothetical protein